MLNSPEASGECTKVPVLPASSTNTKAEPQPPGPNSKSSEGSTGLSGPGGASKGQGAAKGKENKSTQSRAARSGGKGASVLRGLSERRRLSALNGSEPLRTKPPSKRTAGAARSGSSADGERIKYLHILQESEDRVVWRAQRRATASAEWTDVAIKCYRTEPEYVRRYENEVACYRQAASMQVSNRLLCLFTVLFTRPPQRGESKQLSPHHRGAAFTRPVYKPFLLLRYATIRSGRFGLNLGVATLESVAIPTMDSALDPSLSFRRLAHRQGVSIAELLRWDMRLHISGEARPRVGLMVSWAGGTYDVLPPAGLARARAIVEELHRLGVAHGDVACCNMGYDPKTGRVVLFDFSEGGTRAGFGDVASFGSACEEDLERLDEEMEFVTKHPEMCRHYV